MKRRVVVTGLGVVTPLGCRVDELWERVLRCESGIRLITAFDTERQRVKFAGEISNWNPDGHIPPKEAKRLDRFSQFAMVAGIDAVVDSGLDFTKEDTYRCGVFLGTGIGGLLEIETQHEKLLTKGPERVSAFTVPKLMLNAAGGQLSIQYKLRGPNATVATACASATNAIGEAFKLVQQGEADVMITGGTEATVTPMGISAFANMRALSERNDDITHASRPFDADRDGFVLSEGAGLLVIEDLDHAKRRGARIYAELLGYGVSSDGAHLTQPDETGDGAARAMANAMRDASVKPEQMDYINLHGTSTPLGDAAETTAIKRVFGDHAFKMSTSSTKGQLGHLLGASGGVETVLTVLTLGKNLVPPTSNYQTPDPVCDLDYTPNEPRERRVDVAMKNSFGFGGHNACVVLSKLRNGA
jgi:3-oxoacyl-[acyl-carrier-protein] synthase II